MHKIIINAVHIDTTVCLMSYQQASDEAINYKWHFKECVIMSGYTF